LGLADADDVSGAEDVIAADLIVVDERPVAAVEIAKGPTFAGEEDLGVLAAGALVLNDDLVRGRTADRDDLAGGEAVDVGPFGAFTDD
jgi:hypothetical protein